MYAEIWFILTLSQMLWMLLTNIVMACFQLFTCYIYKHKLVVVLVQ